MKFQLWKNYIIGTDMKNKISKYKNGAGFTPFRDKSLTGFTLVEMMVAVLVFSIIIGAISGILVSGIREQRKTLVFQVMLDQLSYNLEYMGRALRMAKKQIAGDPVCLSQNGLNYEIVEIEPGISGLKFINTLQNSDCQAFYLKNGQLKYKKGINTIGEKTFDLSSGDLNITSFKFNFSGESQTDTLQPRVTFSFEMAGKGFLPETQQKIQIQTTISQRMLDVEYY